MMTLSNDMQLFQGFVGGMLIGISALVLLLGIGKIAGISGILGNAISTPKHSIWRWTFLFGLLGGAFLYSLFNGSLHAEVPEFDWKLAIAAVLVGVGTRIGSGCTSGHGVCGIGRGSTRSITATLIFMLSAIVTVAIFGR